MINRLQDSMLNFNAVANEIQNKDNFENKISFAFDFEAGDFVTADGAVKQLSGAEALSIWIQKILRTEKHKCEAYRDTEYGTGLETLVVGSRFSRDFVESEVKREITEALMKNNCIKAITNYNYEYKGDSHINISFDVESIYNTSREELIINA